jgi:serine O-acetyltransferase
MADIGNNCWINQQVTIGHKDKTGRPQIGDNVRITAGAKVIGNIKIGNNVTVGANAVVVKDVPDHCVVVGVPAYIVKKNGIAVREKL